MTSQNTSATSGVQTAKMRPNSRSIARAAAMEPMARKGQRTSCRMPSATATWTWLVSLVNLVSREGVPKWSTSEAPRALTFS